MRNPEDFWYNFNYFYAGVAFKYFDVWERRHLSIKDSGFALKEIEDVCRKNVKATISDFEEHLRRISAEEIQRERDNLHKRVKSL